MQTGTQIGKYIIGRKLGAGGMADVYLATDTVMGRDVALKVLPPEFARDAERIHRFQKEVQASAALSHPNIIPVYDVGEAQAEGFTYHYYTMALLPSGDLKQRIEQGLTPEQSLSIIKAIADALGYAHDKGLVHRDIKPENILFDESDRPVLTDLGIAKAINSGTKMTGTGMSIGTPHYMSPEQAKGESDLDGRSDIYALGIMLFEMLTGNVPYQGDNTMAVGIMHIQNPLPELPQHLKQYQGLLDNCLAKDKASRYQHAQSLIQDIDRLSQGQSVKASQKTRVVQGVQTHPQSSANHGLKWGVGGALIATLLVIGVYFYQQNTGPQRYSSPASQQGQASIVNQPSTQSTQPVSPQKSETELAQARLAELAITRQLDELAKAAEADIAALRLTRPKGNNALEKIGEMEQLKPNNALAAALTAKLTETYRDLTLNAIQANQFDKAQGYIDTLEAIKPGYSLAQGLLTEYERKEREAAILGSVEAVKSAIAKNKFSKASDGLHTLKRLSPKHPQLNSLTEQYERAKKVFESVERYVGKMVIIPSGSFMMGCATRDYECDSDEKPRHRVNISSFKLMEGEVTFSLWDACVRAGGCLYNPNDKGWGRGDRPVINVSYSDITRHFIPWLNRTTGQTFRLPSEAEWEYAARASADTRYSWGNNIERNKANCDGCGSQWDGKQTSLVKSFPANQFGLYDMHGNVWEWTADCWNDSYKGAPSNGKAWTRGKCERRVLRGGAWSSNARIIRSSYRSRSATEFRTYTRGFRLAQDM